MNTIIEKLTGMDKLTDQVIATDFLIAAKSGVRNYCIALTETASDEVRQALRKQLNDAIGTHEMIINYMIKNNYYHVYNLDEQINLDINTSNTALNLADKFMQ